MLTSQYHEVPLLSCLTNLRCIPWLNITQSHREIIWLHSLHWSQTAQCSQMRSGSRATCSPMSTHCFSLSCMKNIWSAFLVLNLVCSLCFVYLFKANVLRTPGCGVAPLIDRLGVHPREVRGCNVTCFPESTDQLRNTSSNIVLSPPMPCPVSPHKYHAIPWNLLSLYPWAVLES